MNKGTVLLFEVMVSREPFAVPGGQGRQPAVNVGLFLARVPWRPVGRGAACPASGTPLA